MSTRGELRDDEFDELLAEHMEISVEELRSRSEEFSLPPLDEWKRVEDD